MENIFVVRVNGGLSNCLRTMLSYYEYAKSINKQLVVVWNKTEACPGTFLEFFEPIDDIIFENKKPDYYGISGKEGFPPNLKLLKLKPFIQSILDEKIKKLNNDYIAVHIRRTDLVNLKCQYRKKDAITKDSEFFEFLDKSDKYIYIATDNVNTYNIFCDRYGDRIVFPYHQTRNGLRKTSLQDSIIDQYMCIHAKEFMGTRYSSFTGIINHMRNNMK